MADFDLGDAELKTSVDLSGLSAGLAQAESQAAEAGNRAGSALSTNVAGAVAAGVGVIGVAVGGALASSVSAASDFEAAVNNLAAISGDALSQAGFSFDDVSAKALELGQTTA